MYAKLVFSRRFCLKRKYRTKRVTRSVKLSFMMLSEIIMSYSFILPRFWVKTSATLSNTHKLTRRCGMRYWCKHPTGLSNCQVPSFLIFQVVCFLVRSMKEKLIPHDRFWIHLFYLITRYQITRHQADLCMPSTRKSWDCLSFQLCSRPDWFWNCRYCWDPTHPCRNSPSSI